MEFYDLTHTFTNNLLPFPGDVPPTLVPTASVAADGHANFRLTTGMHVGTHMDAPAHMAEGGKLIADFPAERFITKAHIVDARGLKTIPRRLLIGLETKPNEAVLVCTGWDGHFGSNNYFENYPVFERGFIEDCIASGISFIGMDTPSPDYAPYELHKLMFAKDMLIIENLTNVNSLLSLETCQVAALPIKLTADSAPCRVVAWA